MIQLTNGSDPKCHLFYKIFRHIFFHFSVFCLRVFSWRPLLVIKNSFFIFLINFFIMENNRLSLEYFDIIMHFSNFASFYISYLKSPYVFDFNLIRIFFSFFQIFSFPFSASRYFSSNFSNFNFANFTRLKIKNSKIFSEGQEACICIGKNRELGHLKAKIIYEQKTAYALPKIKILGAQNSIHFFPKINTNVLKFSDFP